MKTLVFFIVFFTGYVSAQVSLINGRILDENNKPIAKVIVSLLGSTSSTLTNVEGYFQLAYPSYMPSDSELRIAKEGYTSRRLPLLLNKENVDIGIWQLHPTIDLQDDLPLVDFIPLDRDGAHVGMGYLTPLQAQRPPFVSAMAFQFSAAFFSPRGLSRSYQSVRINGVLMNDLATGNAPWAHWGGLNAVFNRSQQVHHGLSSMGDFFPDALGQVNVSLSPFKFQKGFGISQAFSNQTYSYRQMMHYHSGPLANGMAFSVLSSRRKGEGFVPGTHFRGHSFFVSIGRKKAKNELHLSFWYTPHWRGKRPPLTDEVARLMGSDYNPNWGMDNGKRRNAQTRRGQRPSLLLGKTWQWSPTKELQIQLYHGWGDQANSRLFYNGLRPNGSIFIGGGQNPSPVYYQRLPSYYLRNNHAPDPLGAYYAEKQLRDQPQLDWNSLRMANAGVEEGYARYVLYEDVVRQRQWTGTALYLFHPKPTVQWRLLLSGRHQSDRFFAQPIDLLGAKKVYNLEAYAEGEAQNNNLLDLPQAVGAQTPFLYHYKMSISEFALHTFRVATMPKWQWVTGGYFALRKIRRYGYFKNGRFPNDSWGIGTPVRFLTGSLIAGIDYFPNGRHHWAFYGQWQLRPPTLRSIYPNPRENHFTVPRLQTTQMRSIEARYRWQLPWSFFQLNAYWIERKKHSQVNFYYADGVGGTYPLFIQEVLQHITTNHQGIELGWRLQPLEELSFEFAAAVGKYTYGNDPRLWLYTTPTTVLDMVGFEDGQKDFGVSQLRNYFLGNGPQQAFSLGMQYNDPNYWRLNLTTSYFAANYLPPNPLKRSASFFMDSSNVPLSPTAQADAWSLLVQQRLPNYFLLNAFVSKSWKVKQYYFGFFLSAQNILNQAYKTGGFEQGRNANYAVTRADQERTTPLFGPKYWWGRGSTFFGSIYVRF